MSIGYNQSQGIEQLANNKWFARIVGLGLGFIGWNLLAMLFPRNVMPYPLETISLAWGLVESGVWWSAVKITFIRTFWGFLGSLLLGGAIGVFMGVNNYTQRFFLPYVVLGLSVPAIAWAAITTLVFGFSMLSPVTATILTTFPYIAINVWKGVESLEADLINMSRGFDVSNARLLKRLILPSAGPFLFSATRYSLAISWKIVTIAEMFASSSGIGYRFMKAYDVYKFEEAWAWASLFIIIILMIEYGAIKPIERRVFEYREDADFQLLG